MKRSLLLAVIVAGCSGGKTGALLIVGGTSGEGQQPVDAIEVHVGRSGCSEFVHSGASGERPYVVAVGRDLASDPFRLLVHADDPDERLAIDLVAFSGQAPVGRTHLVTQPFLSGTVDEYFLGLEPPLEPERYGPPGAEADPADCFCHDGLVRIAAADGVCMGDIATDTPSDLSCPPIQRANQQFARCDGELVEFESSPRPVPCFTWDGDPNLPNTACWAGTRRCIDTGGLGYDSACSRDFAAPATLCAGELAVPNCQDPPWARAMPPVTPVTVAADPTDKAIWKLCGGPLGARIGALVALPMGGDLAAARVALIDPVSGMQGVLIQLPATSMTASIFLHIPLGAPVDGLQVPLLVDDTFYLLQLSEGLCP
jgi:hypothetical protein